MLWSLSLETQKGSTKIVQAGKVKQSTSWHLTEQSGTGCIRELGSVILWDRVRSQLALVGVWVVQMAWLARSVCSAEAEKARLATRGHLGQPGLCFNAWPQSTWRRKEKRANGGEGWKQWRQEESVTQGGAKLRKPASPWSWGRLCLCEQAP